jgi:nitrous oxidase accessory protein
VRTEKRRPADELGSGSISIGSSRIVCVPVLVVMAITALMILPTPLARARTLRADGDSVTNSTASTLQNVIDAAEDGDVIEIGPGDHFGPIRIERAIRLRGAGGSINGQGKGRVVTVAAPGAQVEGLTIHNSGTEVGRSDACIYLEPEASGAIIRDNSLYDCAFGIWVNETDGAQLIGNRIRGREGIRMTDRGNGIQLHDASHLLVSRNDISGSRDGIYVAATEDSVIEGNETHGQRFGIHYMFAYRNTIRDNRSSRNKIGFALMGSFHLVVTGNHAYDNTRNGLLFRDVQFCKIEGNRLERNGTGLFFFSSTENEIVDNEVLDNELGIKVWAGSRRNRVENNLVRGNRQQIFYVGAEDQIWGQGGRGNRWGDYLGWDQDGDGVGDRPYRVNGLKARLLYRYPAVVLLLRSPALEILLHMAERLPILRSPTIVDVSPLVGLGALGDDATAATAGSGAIQ